MSSPARFIMRSEPSLASILTHAGSVSMMVWRNFSLSRQLFLGHDAVGDVAGDALDGDDPSGRVGDGNVPLLGPDDPAVLPDPAERERLPGVDLARGHSGELGTVIGVDDLEAEVGIGIMLVGGVAGHCRRRRADVLELPLRPDTVEVDQVLGVLGQPPEGFLALPQGLLGHFPHCYLGGELFIGIDKLPGPFVHFLLELFVDLLELMGHASCVR